MTSPLTRYVTLIYATYFVLLLVPLALVALPVETDVHMVYLMILPLAAVDVIAFAGTLLLLSSRGELETLQAYGVADRSIGTPLAIATCAPLAAFSAAAIPLASNPWNALLFAAIGLIVTISVPLVIVRRCWRQR
jgi:hypothetical protein